VRAPGRQRRRGPVGLPITAPPRFSGKGLFGMIERIRRASAKAGLNGQSIAPASPERWALFGPPQLLEGEDAAAYDQLLARICAAVKPVDVIDEIFIVDVASLEWEVLRWRRLKFSLLRGLRLQALENFLREHVDYFASELAEILRDILRPSGCCGGSGE
jgi:hypothetical protein